MTLYRPEAYEPLTDTEWSEEKARVRNRPDYMKGIKLPAPPEGALLTGETGVLLTARRIGLRGFDDDLYALVRANVDNEAEELMWRAPGTLFAALAMCELTNEERWRQARDETADKLLERRNEDGSWTQRLYGEEYRGLTPPHGLVGNVQMLLWALETVTGSQPSKPPRFCETRLSSRTGSRTGPHTYVRS
jgi:hypothetical protein